MTGGGDGGPLIFIVAGEPSGDLLGGRLMAALTAQSGGAIRFAGIGGEAMAAQGLKSLIPMNDLAMMGIAEVVRRLPTLIGHLRRTVAEARRLRPAAVVTIDAPGFNFRLARRLVGAGMPLIHMVAPSVWAWRPRRAREVARFLDHLLALLPFEPPYFEAEGLPCTFVGHPTLEDTAPLDGPAWRARNEIPEGAPLLAVLPGSRRGEVAHLLPVFADTLARLAADMPDLHVVTTTVPGVAERVAAAAARWPVPATVVTDRTEHGDALAAADAALAASGTVTLELAKARTPMVVAYKLAWINAAIARRLLRIRQFTLINLVLDEPVIPEFIQEGCTAPALANACRRFLVDPAARADQIADIERGLAKMVVPGAKPSDRAARVILDLIGTPVRDAQDQSAPPVPS